MDMVGLVAAAATGSAQPLMSLLIGNITNAFLNFEIAIKNPSDTANIDATASNFKTVAAKDASYFSYIGS